MGFKKVLILLLLSIMPFAGFSQEINHWEQAGITEADIHGFLTTEKCYSSEQSFQGCIQAVNVFLMAAERPLKLSNIRIQTNSEMGDLFESASGIQIRYFKESPSKEDQDIIAEWKQYAEERAKATQSWKEFYIASLTSKVNFETLLLRAIAVTKKEKMAAKIGNALNVYLGSIYDPHTYFKPKSVFEKQFEGKDESLSGIGVILGNIKKRVFVQQVVDNGPAMRTGIKYNDIITHVDDTNIEKKDLDFIVGLIKGKEGTSVKITVNRGGQPKSFVVVRGKVILKRFDSQVITDSISQEKIGIIRIADFMQKDLCKRFYETAADLFNNMGATRLILDLRNNGGGSLQEVLCMVSMYGNKGDVLFSVQNPKTNKEIENPITDWNDAPIYDAFGTLVILMNANSASASEIMAGALQDLNKAVVIGERSFGKGTMQAPSDNHLLREELREKILFVETKGRFHLPSGRSNQLVGIIPDIEVFSKPDVTEEEKFVLREADYYSNTISASEKSTYVGNPAQTKTIKECIQLRNVLGKEYQESLTGVKAPDYQLLYAKEAAVCL